jgi:hypothetical protein
LLGSLRIIFTAAILEAFPQVSDTEMGMGNLSRCGNANFGDFQCNNSLAMAKYFKTLSGYTGKIDSDYMYTHSIYLFIDIQTYDQYKKLFQI